jgi:hypothetical protein
MPGDNYKSPQFNHGSTVLENDNVLEFRKASEYLVPYSAVEARNDVDASFRNVNPEIEHQIGPVECAGMQLKIIQQIRAEMIAA